MPDANGGMPLSYLAVAAARKIENETKNARIREIEINRQTPEFCFRKIGDCRS